MANDLSAGRHLKIAYDARICTVTIDRRDEGNRWNARTTRELRELVDELTHDNETQVVVITGAGEDFCLGSFNPAIRGAMRKEDVVEFVMEANRLLDTFETLPQITIAAINGRARGSGVEFALACDLRYVSDRATLAFPEADMGGFPGAGGPVRLPLAVGAGRAIELVCTGEVVPAEQMVAIGFAQRMFESARFIDEVMNIARRMASKGPLALRGAKRIVRARLALGHAEARALSDRLRSELEWSHDVTEAMTAHEEGRKPVFHGN